MTAVDLAKDILAHGAINVPPQGVVAIVLVFDESGMGLSSMGVQGVDPLLSFLKVAVRTMKKRKPTVESVAVTRKGDAH